MTETYARYLAGRHRDLYGDDVIEHRAEDLDGCLLCRDCTWGVVYGETKGSE